MDTALDVAWLPSRLGADMQDAEAARRAAWMAAAQDGDARAYRLLLRECAVLAAAVARRQGVPPGAVDDVVQDTLLTVHRVRHTYDPARPFDPWLRAIAGRRAVDALRRRGRQGARERQSVAGYETHADPADSPLDDAERGERAQALGRAIATLPPGQREAVEQLGLHERSLAEAAELTGRSTGALKVNLHRALQALRGRMGGRP